MQFRAKLLTTFIRVARDIGSDLGGNNTYAVLNHPAAFHDGHGGCVFTTHRRQIEDSPRFRIDFKVEGQAFRQKRIRLLNGFWQVAPTKLSNPLPMWPAAPVRVERDTLFHFSGTQHLCSHSAQTKKRDQSSSSTLRATRKHSSAWGTPQ